MQFNETNGTLRIFQKISKIFPECFRGPLKTLLERHMWLAGR